MPRLEVLYNDYRSHGFTALSVNIGEDMERVVKPWARQCTHPALRDDGSVWSVYTQHNAIPLNYIIDTSGVIRYWSEGFDEGTVRNVIQNWLPDPIEHDVNVTMITAPYGNADSGASQTPACSVANAGATTEAYSVRLRIGTGYEMTASVTGHEPGEVRCVTFPDWTAQGRGRNEISCSTELAGDDIPNNDRARSYATVQVYDAAIAEIIAPAESLDSGSTVLPAAVVRNPGTVADLIKVKFFIGADYVDSMNVALQPGRCDTVVLDPWLAALLGTFPVRCTAAGRRDLNPANNRLSRTVLVKHCSGIEEVPDAAGRLIGFDLGPNPMERRTTIRYELPRAAAVELRIYAANGALVRTLVAGWNEPGSHAVEWDGRDVERGVYYCRLMVDGAAAVRKLVKVK